MDAIANLIESKLLLKEKTLTVTLNYGLVVHGYFIAASDFKQLAEQRSYRFLTKDKTHQFKKHFSMYGVKKLKYTMLIHCSQLQKIEYKDSLYKPKRVTT